MSRALFAIAAAVLSVLAIAGAEAQGTVSVGVPASAGPVVGTTENSDAFIWRLFTEFTKPISKERASPALFETWASDDDTFAVNPHWPTGAQSMKFHSSTLAALKTSKFADTKELDFAQTIDVQCQPPPGAAIGNFPKDGNPAPCVAEQVARNRSLFDYIVNNNLNTKAGLAAAYAKSLNVDMPTDSIAIKGDWIPVMTLLRWIPQLRDIDDVRRNYYTATVGSFEYALVSMHVASRQNPNWVWGTFEHQMNPGRCDYMGCFDSFGSDKSAVLPNTVAFNTQYGPCNKTPQLKRLMIAAGLAQVWQNYCLKSTEVDYTSADGSPYILGNSVIEGIVGNGTIAASSCITCHSYASFGADGKPTRAATAILPFNPTGKPIQGVLANSLPFSFMWGVILAPPR